MKRTRRPMGPHYSEPVWLWTDRIDGTVNGAAPPSKEVARVKQPVELENKVALIVGGASDRGNQLAVAFAERGMDVAVIYFEERDSEAAQLQQQIEGLGRRCLLLRGAAQENLDQDDFAQWAVATVLETLGRLDVFINVSEKRFALGALNGNGPETEVASSKLFPHFRIMKAALDEIVS